MKKLFGKRKKWRQTASNTTLDDDSGDEECQTRDSFSKDSHHDIMSDEQLMEGDFVAVNSYGKKGTSGRCVATLNVIDGEEIQGVFMKRIPGHCPNERKQAFIIDHNDEASFDKKKYCGDAATSKKFVC